MARLTLTATPQPRTGASAPLNLTTLIAAGSLGANTGVSFTNSGREVLAVTVGGTSTAGTVNIGVTIEGQSVTPITVTFPASGTSIIGPFASDINQAGGIVTLDFGTAANVTGVALLQNAGVS